MHYTGQLSIFINLLDVDMLSLILFKPVNVLGLTWSGLKPMIYHTHGKHANHYITDTVQMWFEVKKKLGDIIIISSKCNLFSPWYGWKIAHLALNNNHSLIQNKSFPLMYTHTKNDFISNTNVQNDFIPIFCSLRFNLIRPQTHDISHSRQAC
jgi:hypothetical protein